MKVPMLALHGHFFHGADPFFTSAILFLSMAAICALILSMRTEESDKK